MIDDNNIKIIVATHKDYKMPDDKMYIPLSVGAQGKNEKWMTKFERDDSGENISNLNPYFCELTGLFWAWKNCNSDYVGLVHYRRHFCVEKKKDLFDSILSYEELQPLLKEKKVFVPKKRKYYIESLYSHYAHTHYGKHLDETRKIIMEKYPEYINCFDRVLKQKSGYMFNMMIMKKSLLDEYCLWVFDILFELNKRIDASELSPFQSRYLGRVSEIIFNVWLQYQIEIEKISKDEIKELPYIFMDDINWIKKIGAFLNAKFFGKKY